MTSTLNEVTINIISSSSFIDRFNSLGVIAILLLLALLAHRELVRAFHSSSSGTWLRTLNIAVLPMILMFSFIVTIRIVRILYPS